MKEEMIDYASIKVKSKEPIAPEQVFVTPQYAFVLIFKIT
jgi:hypothetical protein